MHARYMRACVEPISTPSHSPEKFHRGQVGSAHSQFDEPTLSVWTRPSSTSDCRTSFTDWETVNICVVGWGKRGAYIQLLKDKQRYIDLKEKNQRELTDPLHLRSQFLQLFKLHTYICSPVSRKSITTIAVRLRGCPRTWKKSFYTIRIPQISQCK